MSIKLFVLMIISVAAFSSISLASQDFYVSYIFDEYTSAGENVDFYYNIENVADHNAYDVIVKAYMPELEITSASKNQDIGKNKYVSGFLLMDIPNDAEPGEYVVRFTARNDDESRVKYRFIYIE